jgi:Staphylococcal nuclease homologue
MKKLLVAALLAAFVAPAFAGVNIVDGDTLKINGVTVRIVEIDTPETYKSRCEHELELGLKAKERLRQMLDSGPVRFEPTGTDRYRRTLARVFVGDVNVGETLIKEGHALRYRAGGEAKLERLRVWCGPDATLDGGSRWTGKVGSADKIGDAAILRRKTDRRSASG